MNTIAIKKTLCNHTVTFLVKEVKVDKQKKEE